MAAGLAAAQLRHSDAITYLPRISKKRPLRNRVILLLRILPICSCWPGVREGGFPPAALVRRIASLMQGATDYHHLIDCWSVANLPCGLARALSEPSEWESSVHRVSPLTDSLQESSMYGSFDSLPGEVSSAHRLLAGSSLS